MKTIIPGTQATDHGTVGGKAANLARLTATGFDVPPFFVISADALVHDDDEITPREGVTEAVMRAAAEIGPGPYAVRSSGRAEDGISYSHAGQFETLLDVDAADLVNAARQVWASGFSETVDTYRSLQTGGKAEAPAIIVQQMVPARAAGVAFSADPVTGVRQRAIIAATSGLADRLVAGEENGEHWTVSDHGGVITGPQGTCILTAAEARAVANLAWRAEVVFGHPQDLEWAFDKQRLMLLQSRAITTPLRTAPAADENLIVFDNSNVVESYPGIVSPLTYTFATYCYDRVYRAFTALLGVTERRITDNTKVFANLLGRIDGRVYYNLGNWYRALAMLPGFALNRGYMETMMGVSDPLPVELTDEIAPPPAKGWRKVVELARVGRVCVGLIWHALLLPRTKRRFYQRLERALAESPDLTTANLTRLAGEYRKIEAELLDRWDAPLVNDFLCMIGFGASRALLQRWCGSAGLALHNDLMIGQGGIVSAEPAQRIARMAELARRDGAITALRRNGAAALASYPALHAEFQAYIEKFGDRCTEELKLESVTLEEDPTPLIDAIVAGSSRNKVDTRPNEESNWHTPFQGHRLRRWIARGFCNWARSRVRDRENLRFERTRIFGHARRVFLAIGRELEALGRLEDQRDVFMLTVTEVLGAIEGTAVSHDLHSIAAVRKRELEAAGDRPNPPERITVRGAAIRADEAMPTPCNDSPSPDTARTGTGCSAGLVRARARIIRDPRRERLDSGEILVARNTDPGWIAVFANACAIVVERGSLLSHSAIVARELGIPCVVGLPYATRWISSGELIEVNGSSGRVEKCRD
ncbi:PEP/pyruvate-binding domain-containing protein [Arhodomonas sp. AD133]|uniref:PEP/pyruvate-binding domain-containing protein n=1 Tax=Arhodomonas sp. AD133 TaxID=3415009 RepID=UPI003EBC1B09